VTSRLLLGHQSGVRHYRGNEIESTRHYTNRTEPLDIFKNDPLLFEPGSKFSYSTYAYNVLGCAIEGASGMSYLDYVQTNIFQPARMDRIRDDDVYAIIPNRAQGYFLNAQGEWRNSGLADTSNKIPGGGFCSTVEDLARFAIAVQTGMLLKPATLQQVFTPLKLRDGADGPYGLGWALSVRNGRKEAAHGGGQQRISTYLYMLPEGRLAVVLMTNREGARLPDLARSIADALEGR
jgi:CubicO group peptidase (beta-lactamase class C family)